MQKHWIYKNDDALITNISVYHGDSSKHLLIYSDQTIIKLDFLVKEDKSYSFFIEDDLMELSVKIKNQKFEYSLHRSKDNKLIPDTNDRHFPQKDIVKGLLFIALVIIFVLLLFYFLV